nr:cysteine--1-D-myo-inosityl 2-amino-2-deoxy-alpha-D-glucopyranoside ligase [Sediminivirga luteola]
MGQVKSWTAPEIPRLAGRAKRPELFDTVGRAAVPTPKKGDEARLYVCGITPYDATHLGHAATYVAFDLLCRLWRDAGLAVTYVQNTTDVDDPLLERATATGEDWRELAERQTELFRQDMEALRVIPPDHYIGAVESIPQIVPAVERLLQSGAAYTVRSGDVYYDLRTRTKPPFGTVSGLGREEMLELFAERGGDPGTPGKRDPLDPLLWRAAREGEPSWEGGELGPGRPGWHIECAIIAAEHSALPLTVQGGGSDLIFPHHEMSAQHAQALTGERFAKAYLHTGMVAYQGEKMSKSRGNLVFVSRLRAQGVDPRVIRLVLLSHHYRCDWEFDEAMLDAAAERLERWTRALAEGAPARDLTGKIRRALADDLDAARAMRAVDAWAERAPEGDPDGDEQPAEVAAAIDALLGIRLS